MASRMFRHQNKAKQKVMKLYARCDMCISGTTKTIRYPLIAKDVDNIRKMEKQYMRS